MAGGGPAGAALAIRLAQLGRSVAIVEKAVFPRRHVGESLTGGLMPLLDVLGLRSQVESAGFLRSDYATVNWAGQTRRTSLHTGGLQVDRAVFDRILLRAAASYDSVRVFQPCRIVDRELRDGTWHIRLDGGRQLYARHLADAAGRAGVLSHKKTAWGAPTYAVYAYWKGVRSREADTLVEAGDSAWYWGAPLPGGDFNATVFVDRDRATPAEYLKLIEASELMAPLIGGDARCGEIRVCDATPYSDEEPLLRGWIKTGEAAVSIDPLSSQGVQTAVGTALHAALVLNTVMQEPADTELARGFYRDRLRESTAFHASAARRFYREQSDFHGGEFWKRRAGVATPDVAMQAPPAPRTRVRIARHAEFAEVAVAGQDRILYERGIRLGQRTFAYASDGLPLAGLMRELDSAGERGMEAVEAVRLWSKTMRPEQALGLLNKAWREGILEEA